LSVPSSTLLDILAKTDISRFNLALLHFGQLGIFSVLTDLEKKL